MYRTGTGNSHTDVCSKKKKKKSKWSVFLLASFQSLLFFVQMAKLFRDSISKDCSDFSCSSFLGMAGNEKATSLESRFHGKGITRLEYRVKVTLPKNENKHTHKKKARTFGSMPGFQYERAHCQSAHFGRRPTFNHDRIRGFTV